MIWSRRQADFMRRVIDGPERFCTASGSVRSGKSTVAMAAWLTWIGTHFRHHQFMVLARTASQVRDNLVPMIRDVTMDAGADFAHVAYKRLCVVGSNRILLRDGSDSSSAARIQGMTISGAFLDEGALMPESLCDEVIARCSVVGAKILMTCNPEGGPGHWFHRRFVSPQNVLSQRFTLMDNPGLDADYVADLAESLDGIAFRRKVLGEWTAATGNVYPFWTIDSPRNEDIAYAFLSVDHGSASTTAFLLWVVAAEGHRAWVVGEWVHHGHEQGLMTESDMVQQALLSLCPAIDVRHVVCDPAALSMKVALAHRGMRVMEGHNDLLVGIEHTGHHLSQGLVRIGEGCGYLLSELAVYRWDERAAERGLDRPIFQRDHAVDALRYGCMALSRGWTRTDQVDLGQLRGVRQRQSDMSVRVNV